MDPNKTRPAWSTETPVRVGISSCLLGREVRWDAGHKRDRFLTDVLGPFVEWVPVCPELEAGMGIPREPVHLRGAAGARRLIGTRSGEDWTRRMEQFSVHRAHEPEALDLCGYVLKKDSPSGGKDRVKVRGAHGLGKRDGQGLFAAALQGAMPALPVEEEGRLHDPRIP